MKRGRYQATFEINVELAASDEQDAEMLLAVATVQMMNEPEIVSINGLKMKHCIRVGDDDPNSQLNRARRKIGR